MKLIEKDNMSLMQREDDGYVNATALCKSASKKWNHYHSNTNTKAFINELSSDAGIPTSLLVQVTKGNYSNKKEQGTYIHPKVAIHLAQWLSPKFAVFVSNIIFDYLNNPFAYIEEKNPFEGLIIDEPFNYSIYPRVWHTLMEKFYGSKVTPSHVIYRIYDKVLGDGAVDYIRQLRTEIRTKSFSMYCFLTDEGRDKIYNYVQEICQKAQDCTNIVQFEQLLYDSFMLENK